MFGLGFLFGFLVIPAIIGLTWIVLFLIDWIPYTIETLDEFFKEKKAKRVAKKISKTEKKAEKIAQSTPVEPKKE